MRFAFGEAHKQPAVDRPSEILIKRCRSCLIDPPRSDWIPICVLESKA